MSPKAVTPGPTWFRVAVQALIVLAQSDGNCPSATIAADVDAHAVFLRRVLAHLVRSQIVEAREGRDGGYRLARPADRITLAEVYRAVKSVDGDSDHGDCGNTSIESVLDEMSAEAEQRALDVYDRYTLATVLKRIALLQ